MLTLTDILYILKKNKERTIFWAVLLIAVCLIINRAISYLKTEERFSKDSLKTPDITPTDISSIRKIPEGFIPLPVKKAFATGERDFFTSPQKEEEGLKNTVSISETVPKVEKEQIPYIFTGVIDMGGDTIAVLESKKGKEVHFKRKGEKISGMKITDIDKSKVILNTKEGNEITLERKTK